MIISPLKQFLHIAVIIHMHAQKYTHKHMHKLTFLCVEEVIVTHEDPVVVEGSGCPAHVEHGRVLSQN